MSEPKTKVMKMPLWKREKAAEAVGFTKVDVVDAAAELGPEALPDEDLFEKAVTSNVQEV